MNFPLYYFVILYKSRPLVIRIEGRDIWPVFTSGVLAFDFIAKVRFPGPLGRMQAFPIDDEEHLARLRRLTAPAELVVDGDALVGAIAAAKSN